MEWKKSRDKNAVDWNAHKPSQLKLHEICFYFIGYMFNIKRKQIQHKPVSFGLLIVTKLSSKMTYMK